MANTDFQSIDEYLATRSEAVQQALQRVRAIIRKALPKAEELISYQIPAFKLFGGPVLYVAGWKKHYSLYPATDALMKAFGSELEPYRASKGTLQFSLTEAVPTKLIERIAKFRAKEAEALAEERAAKKPAPTTTAAKRKAPRPARATRLKPTKPPKPKPKPNRKKSAKATRKPI